MSKLIGQSLGRYHILEQLGEGGMAIVYKAYDMRLEADVAVKFIRTEYLAKDVLDRALKRFEREAKALAKLTHPNIVKVIDYGEHQGQPYLVMPYLVGGTLKERMGRPMPWRTAARLLTPIARALEYAHNEGMIHRDVKPSNILITASNEPMLTDFGIAKIIDEETSMDLTGTNTTVGTPEYMAPEQVTSKFVDRRADIYSLGVVFYEMVTGRRPYQADTPMAVMLKQASEPLPRPSQFVPNLPAEVENVIFKALAKKVEDRYENAGVFAAALEQLAAGVTQPVPASQPGSISPTMADGDFSHTVMAPAVMPVNSSQSISFPTPIPAGRSAGRSKTRTIGTVLLGVVVIGLCLIGGGILYATDGFGYFSPATPTSTPVPVLSEDPRSWIPDTLHIPAEMQVSEEGTNTNEQVAALYSNPAERFAYLVQVGRETGYFINYVNRDNCSLSSGLTYIGLNPVRMKSAYASLEYMNQLFMDPVTDPVTDLSLKWVEDVGERAFVREWTYQDTCDPPSTQHAIMIRFSRYNGLVGVTVYVRSDLMTKDRLYDIAMNYAQIMDNYMISLTIP